MDALYVEEKEDDLETGEWNPNRPNNAEKGKGLRGTEADGGARVLYTSVCFSSHGR